MAKGKSVKFVWMCLDCNMITGSNQTMKDKVKDLKRNKYCAKSRKMEAHKAKLIKKAN